MSQAGSSNSDRMPIFVRAPDIRPDAGPLVWSKLPEFALAYNGYSVVIPYVEYYLNKVMNQVRIEHCGDDPQLRETIGTFVRQEVTHAQYHVRFNKRMFDTIPALKPLIDRVVADLALQRETRSLAFNSAYCAGFESIATFDAQYLHEECDEYFENADPHGANLLLWHVAEEFEHRSVCHDAFDAVSGSYFTRIHGLLYAFVHIGSAFMQAEQIVLDHYRKQMSPEQARASAHLSKSLFWRQLRYVAPRMLRIFLPWYNPRQVPVPPRIQAALNFFHQSGPIDQRPESLLATRA